MPLELTPEARERADGLHDGAIVLLAHDHMMTVDDFRRDLVGGVTAKVVQATVDARIFEPREVYEPSLYGTEGFMLDAMTAWDQLLNAAQTDPSELLIVKSAEDIREAKRSGRLGLIMGSEGAKHLEGSLAALRNFHRLGVRHLQFHWAIRNRLGTAQSDYDEPGLTEFGREVVAEMNRLGMVIDVSHSSPPSITDVLATTTKPIINSHGSARVLCDSVVSLWDDQIRDLADNGGVLAVHFGSRLLVNDDRTTTMDDLIAHFDHIANVGGIDCVGLGPDFYTYGDDDPRGDQVMVNQRRPPMPWTVDLEDTSKLRSLTRALVDRGYPDDHILKILGGNLMRVFEETLG